MKLFCFPNRNLIVTVCLFLYLLSISHALKFKIPKSCSKIYSLNNFDLRNKTKTIVVTIDNVDNNTVAIDENEFVKNCFIRNSGLQSFVIIDNTNFNFAIWKRLKKIKVSEPNIIIFMNYPTYKDLDQQVPQIMLRSKWSLTIIIATTRSDSHICNRTSITDEIRNQLEDFANELWQIYQTVNLIIYFPFVCPDFYITYGEKRLIDDVIIYHRTIIEIPIQQEHLNFTYKGRAKKLTQDYPLITSIYRRFPTSITDCDAIKNYLTFKGGLSDGYCGLDGLIMADIVEYFGFNITKRRYYGSTTYGYVDRNGHVTGSLGNVVRGEVDISFNSRFLAMYGVSGFNFLYYISSDSLCAIIKRSDEIPLWLFPYDVYSFIMWSILLTTLVIVGIFIWLSAKCSKSKIKARLQRYIIDSMTTGLFGISLIKSKFLILKGVCFFSSVIFTAIFQVTIYFLMFIKKIK